jgi:hypothetical protein
MRFYGQGIEVSFGASKAVLGILEAYGELRTRAPLYTIEQSISLESREENKSSPIRLSFSSLVATL